MSRRGLTHIMLMSGFAVLLVTQYQNCSHTQSNLDEQSQQSSTSQSVASEDGRVDLIDRTNQADFKLSFVDQNVIEVQSAASSFGVDGICSVNQNGSQLRWSVLEADQVMDSGLVVCDQSGFHVDVPVDAIKCGQDYRVQAVLATGKPAEVVFRKACPKDIAIVDDSSSVSQCFFEASQEDPNHCERSCYRGGRLINRSEVEAVNCQP